MDSSPGYAQGIIFFWRCGNVAAADALKEAFVRCTGDPNEGPLNYIGRYAVDI